MRLWKGRWVKFAADIPGAFRAKDGRVVGIFVSGDGQQTDAVTEDLEIVSIAGNAPYIAVVDHDGHNLMIDVNGTICQVKVSLRQNRLEGITDRDDIPPARIRHLPADWQPRREPPPLVAPFFQMTVHG